MLIIFAGLCWLVPASPTAQEAGRSIAIGAVAPEVRAAVGFNPAESRGVFIGVNRYTAPSGVTPPNLKSCVNDAVDLAAAFLDLGLIEPSGIVLALSGEPSKPASVAALDRLRKAGVKIAPDARRDTIDGAVSDAAAKAGPQGILFLTWSSHGFEVGNVQYLTPENFYSMTNQPATHEISGRAISEATLSTTAQSSPAARRVLLFDACRESKALAPGIPQLIGNAKGLVTLYAVTAGAMANDGSRNGEFTARVLEALTSPDPPPSLHADRNGHITIGTLLEHLGTAGRIEDTAILTMPLRQHPREFSLAVDRARALEHFRAAKGVELRLPNSDQRPLDDIGIRAFENALLTTAGPKLVEEADALLGDDASRSDFRKRRSFAAAWRDIQKAAAESAAAPAAPAPPSASLLSMPSTFPEAPPAAPPVQAGTPALPPAQTAPLSSAPEMPSIPAEAVEAAAAVPASDIALVAPRSGVPGIELTEKPAKSLSRLEAQSGVTFAWRATGEAYGARYRYRLNDQSPVEDYRRVSVTLSNLEAGRRHTFQVQAQTRQGASEPAVYAFEVRANEPPAVAFAEAPAQGAQVAARSVRVRLTGADLDGKVTRYTLAVNDPDDPQRVFENATGEFELTDKVLEDGLHRLIAQTMDDSGALSPPATRDFTFRYTAVTPTPPPTPKPDYAKKSDDGRFLVSSEGVIHDTKTKLEWIVGPDQDTNYDNAVKWVESCRVAGGGWRMPTRKELLELYQKGKGDHNIDPVFKHTGWYVWAEPRDSSSAWFVDFIFGIEFWYYRNDSDVRRVFGVRSRR
jgi:hypothetical protein